MKENLPAPGCLLPKGGATSEPWTGGQLLLEEVGDQPGIGGETAEAEVAGVPEVGLRARSPVALFEGVEDEVTSIETA
jgi:hypothetical protein